MTQTILTKLKITIKRLLGKCVYGYVYLKNTTRKLRTPIANQAKPRKHKNNFFNFIVYLTEQWRTVLVGLAGFFCLYYGLGAAVSSNINNSLDETISVDAKDIAPGNTVAALIHVLKTQVDDSPWTPALPAIFPAAVLDNLPNFQIGAKDSVRYMVKRLSKYYKSPTLQEAEALLNYPADIWLFSQIGQDKLAPGSAKQYRKALAKLKDFASTPTAGTQPAEYELSNWLSGIENLLEKQLNILQKHVLEHSSDLWDWNADNIFYQTQGTVYTIYYTISALSKDYQDIIVERGQYEKLTEALGYLRKAVTLSPAVIKNAPPQDTFAANHLIYLGFEISRALNNLQNIHHNIIYKRIPAL